MPRVPARRSGVAVWRDGHALVVVVVRAALLVPRLRAPCACLSAARKAARNRFPISICRSWDNYRIPYGQIISALFVLSLLVLFTSRKLRHIIASLALRFGEVRRGLAVLVWICGRSSVLSTLSSGILGFGRILRLCASGAGLRLSRSPRALPVSPILAK